MTKKEQNAYSKGYAAGRKKVEEELEHWDKIHAEIYSKRQETYRSYFNAALSGLLGSYKNWRIGGVNVNNELTTI